jgi:hypothetical protein
VPRDQPRHRGQHRRLRPRLSATTRELASTLGITPKTAGNHIERIYVKIGVSSPAEAAMFAMQHGLVSGWDTAET